MRLLIPLVMALLVMAWVAAQEHIQVPAASIGTDYRVETLTLRATNMTDGCTIRIDLSAHVEDPATPPPPTVPISHTYVGTAACTMLRTLNTADLTKQSLHRRVLNQLVKDGIITGTVVGTPAAP